MKETDDSLQKRDGANECDREAGRDSEDFRTSKWHETPRKCEEFADWKSSKANARARGGKRGRTTRKDDDVK